MNLTPEQEKQVDKMFKSVVLFLIVFVLFLILSSIIILNVCTSALLSNKIPNLDPVITCVLLGLLYLLFIKINWKLIIASKYLIDKFRGLK